MKYIYMALFTAILTLTGTYAGLEWGLNSKPTLDISQCETVIRYEDNSLVCKPKQASTSTLPVTTGEGTLQLDTYNPQETVDGQELQPAKGE